VAEGDGEVLGYLHYDCEGSEPELHRIYVDLERKRAGIGSALLRELHAPFLLEAHTCCPLRRRIPMLGRSTSGTA
jgi:GNAT superfamily N-acetyltransferase